MAEYLKERAMKEIYTEINFICMYVYMVLVSFVADDWGKLQTFLISILTRKYVHSASYLSFKFCSLGQILL